MTTSRRPPLWPDEVILKAFMFRSRGLSYPAISQRLKELYGIGPRWELVRDWNNGDVARAARLRAEGMS